MCRRLGRIATGLLRDEMRFDGVIVTDSLDMGGVTVRYSPAEVAVRSILAGADVLLTPSVPDTALAGLREAAASGRLPISRIDDAVTRVLRVKARLGLHRRSEVSLVALPEVFGRPEFARDALDIADRGITLLRDAAGLLPMDATRPMRALLVAIAGDPDARPGEDFEREIGWRVDFLHTLRFDTRFAPVAPLAEQAALASSVTDAVTNAVSGGVVGHRDTRPSARSRSAHGTSGDAGGDAERAARWKVTTS